MMGPIAAYIVAVSAMLFAALSALTLIATVNRLDPPDVRVPAGEAPRK